MRPQNADNQSVETGLQAARSAVWIGLIFAVAGGQVLYAASPPRVLWWLAPVAFTLLALSLWGRSARGGFVCGLVFGFAYLLPLLGWLNDFLGRDFGVWPWLGLVAVESLFFGLAGAGMAKVSRLPAAPVWMATIVVATEALRSHVPYGGFPWGRVAFTQGEGAYLSIAAFGGAALVSFAVVMSGCALASLRRADRSPRSRCAMVLLFILPVAAGLGSELTRGNQDDADSATVAVVQGGAPDVGIDLMGKSGTVRRNHIAEAERLVADVLAGRAQKPDLVVFPESSNRFDASRADPDLDRISSVLLAPLIAGGIAHDSDAQASNRMIRWDPGVGATTEYAKQQLVPFSEFVPLREVAGAVTPFVGEMPGDMVAGNEPGRFDVGSLRIGVAICYEVAYDYVLAESVQQGANLLVVPTNNAWFGRTEMTYQQLAMARLRAVEHDRAVVVASTSGVSAIIRPDGTVSRRTGQFTAEYFVEQVPLRSESTLATRLGGLPEWGLSGLSLIGLALGLRRKSVG